MPDGSIYEGNLTTGEGEIVLTDAGGGAHGMYFDERSEYLFVAGNLNGTNNRLSEGVVSSFERRSFVGVEAHGEVPTPTFPHGCSYSIVHTDLPKILEVVRLTLGT